MSQCTECGTNFVGTPENPAQPGICKYCEIKQLKGQLAAAERERDELRLAISTPASVWANMLRGTIARPRALDHYEECKTELEQVAKERDTLAAKCAERFDLIRRMAMGEEHWTKLELGHAQSTDCGRDYVPRRELDGVAKVVELHNRHELVPSENCECPSCNIHRKLAKSQNALQGCVEALESQECKCGGLLDGGRLCQRCSALAKAKEVLK